MLRVKGQLEPLCSIYSKEALPYLHQMRQAGVHQIRPLYEKVQTAYVDLETLGAPENLVEEYQHPGGLSGAFTGKIDRLHCGLAHFLYTGSRMKKPPPGGWEEHPMDYAQESLKLHAAVKGKIEIATRVAADSREALSLAYTPGRGGNRAWRFSGIRTSPMS